MPRGAIVALFLFAIVACGEREREAAGPAQPRDDPAHGVYSYDHAKALGIRVDPIPPADQLCPANAKDDGFSAEEIDTPEELAAIDREMATAPSCIADPRFGLIVTGYAVDAVRNAASAFEKGKLICGGSEPSLPGGFDSAERDRFARDRLRRADGVDDDDPLAELVAGCRETPWGADVLLPG